MLCIIRLTFWSLPMIWAAIAVVALSVGYLYYRLFGWRKTLYTPREVAELLRLQEEALTEPAVEQQTADDNGTE